MLSTAMDIKKTRKKGESKQTKNKEKRRIETRRWKKGTWQSVMCEVWMIGSANTDADADDENR